MAGFLAHLFSSNVEEAEEAPLRSILKKDKRGASQAKKSVSFSRFSVSQDYELSKAEKKEKRVYSRIAGKLRKVNSIQKRVERQFNEIVKINEFYANKKLNIDLYNTTKEELQDKLIVSSSDAIFIMYMIIEQEKEKATMNNYALDILSK